MQLTHPDGRYWRGRQLGKNVFARWGTPSKAQVRTTTFKTVAGARHELAGLLEKLERLGYVRDFPESLLDALAANPRDEAPLAVLGDALLAEGDVRGELAALAVQRRGSELGTFLVQRAEGLFGAAADDADRGFIDELTWSPGFLYGARVSERVEGEAVDRRLAEVLQRLLDAPVAALVRKLELSRSWDRPWTGVVHALANAANTELLSSLTVRSDRYFFTDDDPPEESADFAVLWPHLVNLRSLELHSRDVNLGRLELPWLRRLSRTGGGLTAADLSALSASSLPHLEALELGFADDRDEESIADDDVLDALLKCLERPTVRHLALRHLTLSTRFLERLLDGPAFRKLASLDLGACVVDEEEAAELLRDSRKTLSKLKRLTSPCWPVSEDSLDLDDDGRPLGEPVLEGLANLVDDAWKDAER